jgi:hypothetical protein
MIEVRAGNSDKAKPFVRRGRKAPDLSIEMAELPKNLGFGNVWLRLFLIWGGDQNRIILALIKGIVCSY